MNKETLLKLNINDEIANLLLLEFIPKVKPVKHVVKGKKQKVNESLNMLLKKKARRKKDAHERKLKNQKRRKLNKGIR